MKTQRLTTAALVLLAALCAAACSGPTPSNGDSVSSPTPTPEQPNTGAASQQAGPDPVNDETVRLSQQQPFMVLIREGSCPLCDSLEEKMKGLHRKGVSRTLFFVLNTDDGEKHKDDARKLGVSLKDRTSNLPWAAVFEPAGMDPRPPIAGVKDADEVQAASLKLEAAWRAVPYTGAEVDKLLDDLRANPAQDMEFRKTLLEDANFKAEVGKALAADEAFRAGLAAELAKDPGFQQILKSPTVITRTDFALAALCVAPLLALGLGFWNFRESRRAGEDLRQEHERTDKWQALWRKRTRRSRKALSRVLRNLRSDVKAVDERVKAAVGASSTVRADAEKAALRALDGVVTALSGRQAVAPSPEVETMALKLLGVIDGGVGTLRLEVNNKLEALKNEPPARVNTPTVVGVTKEQLEGALSRTSSDLSLTIRNLGASLEGQIASAQKTLSEKLDDEISTVRADFGISKMMGAPAPAGKDNGRGDVMPAVMAPTQAGAPAQQRSEEETERLEERFAKEREWAEERLAGAKTALEELGGLRGHVETLVALEPRVRSLETAPPEPPPGVKTLSGEVADLRRLFEAGEEQRRQALGSKLDREEFNHKVGELEGQLGKSRRQMVKLLKRLMQRLKGNARETAELRRELRDDLGPRLDQQARQTEQRRAGLEKSLQDLVSNWRPDVLDVPKLREAARATSQNVAEVVRRLLDAQEARMAARLPADDEGQAAAAQTLERYQEQLRELAAKVAPLVESTEALTASAQRLSPETGSDLAEFRNQAAEFERVEGLVGEQLRRLRGNSVRSIFEDFRGERQKLEGRLRDGDASAEQFASASLALLDTYAAEDRDGAASPAAASEEQIKSIVSGAEERLMDWYSNFFQLYARLQESRRAGGAIDEALIQETGRVLKVAREVLSRFDIQPEEIVIGQTLYDGRLHDFAVARESSYPTQTIIEVWKSGFRRMRDGATLRRPQVVVAGTGIVTGAT